MPGQAMRRRFCALSVHTVLISPSRYFDRRPAARNVSMFSKDRGKSGAIWIPDGHASGNEVGNAIVHERHQPALVIWIVGVVIPRDGDQIARHLRNDLRILHDDVTPDTSPSFRVVQNPCATALSCSMIQFRRRGSRSQFPSGHLDLEGLIEPDMNEGAGE